MSLPLSFAPTGAQPLWRRLALRTRSANAYAANAFAVVAFAAISAATPTRPALAQSTAKAGTTAASPAQPVVLGYFPDWSTQPGAGDIRMDRYTHLIHAFAYADAEGKLRNRGNLPSSVLTGRASTARVKTILGLGGGSNGANFAVMARDPQKRAQFVSDAVAIVAKTGYDGLDIDWEYPDPADAPLLVQLAREMRAALDAKRPGQLLTLAIPRSNYYGQRFDVAALAPLVDYVNVMAYDQHGPWSHAGHNAALGATKLDTRDGGAMTYANFVDYWLGRGFPASKILIGLPGYGRGFATAQFGDKPIAKAQFPEIEYKKVIGLIGKGWTRRWDADASVPYLVNDAGTEFISYDDEESTRLKAAFARERGLAGVFFWNVAQDFVDGDHPLAAAAQSAWNAPAGDAKAGK